MQIVLLRLLDLPDIALVAITAPVALTALRPPAQDRLPPALTEVEADLKRRLATSVKIVPGLKRGRIEIEYYGEEDLSRLWQLFRRIDV